MNGVRRINMGDTNVRIYRISRDLAVGDLMAMQVNSRLASVTWDEMLVTDGSKEGGLSWFLDVCWLEGLGVCQEQCISDCFGFSLWE